MTQPLLDAALIVKNEEANLPRCLASLNALRPLLSEICIYDTGSTDRTIEMAEAAGARVQQGYWDADFSRARNEAIGMCTAKWVLIIDADEEVRADKPKLERMLRTWLTTDMVGFDTIQIDDVCVDRFGNPEITIPTQRFLRPNRAHYEGAVHEVMRPRRTGAIWRVARAEPDVVSMIHHGYADGAALAGRGERNAEGSEIEIERLEAQGADAARLAQALVNRARSLNLVGDRSGAARDFYRVRGLNTDSPFRRWAGEDLAQMLMSIGAYDDAGVLIRQLRTEGSDPQLCDWLLGKVRAGQGRHQEALELLRQVDITTNALGISLEIVDVIWSRMMAAARVGEHDEALACAVTLMAKHGRVKGLGKLMLSLWGSRDPIVLAQLIIESGNGYLSEIVEELRSQGGAAVADAIESSRSGEKGTTTSPLSST